MSSRNYNTKRQLIAYTERISDIYKRLRHQLSLAHHMNDVSVKDLMSTLPGLRLTDINSELEKAERCRIISELMITIMKIARKHKEAQAAVSYFFITVFFTAHNELFTHMCLC